MVRKTLLMAAVAVLAVPALASAQAQVTATATVGQHAQLSGSGDIAFGTLTRGSAATIDPTSAAGAKRTLDYNHNVTVTFTSVPTALVSGTNTLAVSLTCASQLGAGSWVLAGACSSASIDLDVGSGLTQATLGFGGTITAADINNAPAGTYSATFNIVVQPRT